MIKRFSTITLAMIFLFLFTGYRDSRGLEDLSYAIAIGIDKGSQNLLKLSLQFPAPGSGDSSNR